ncbi:hypothetical protein F5146DRAFT_1133434 [Armillaria mellea]|nr:hypothetical protein F5146DRAFT_1133434 [Armillaria mellea]
MSSKTDPPNSDMMLSLVSPKIASIPVRVDYSLLVKHLFQATRHFVLVGIEDDANSDLTTLEKHGGWSSLEFPLEPREKIRTFRLDEMNGLLAVITWFDEPVSNEGTLRMRLRITRFPQLVPMPGAATQQFPFEITARNNESSPDAWIDIREDLIGACADWKTVALEARRELLLSFFQGDAIAVACRETAAVNILTIPEKDSATATPPYPKLVAAIRSLKISQEYLPAIGQSSMFPEYDDTPDDFVSELEEPPDIIFPSINCFSSIESNIVVVNILALGQSTDIVIHRETLRSFSAHASPLFPCVSVGQYVGDAHSPGRVIIPWEEWGEGKAEVFTGNSGESMVDGSWFATLSRDRRLRIHDFGSWWGAGPQPIGSGGKVILDQFVDYNDAIVQFRENRVLGLVLKDRGDDGWFSSIDVFQVGDLRDKENRSGPSYHDIASRGFKLATTS